MKISKGGKHDAHAFLKHRFPDDKEYVKEFDDISYSLSFFTTGTPDSRFEDAFRSGLGSARAMLQSRIDEITQFWEERQVATKSDPRFAGLEHPELVFVIHGRQILGEFHTFLRALGLKPLEWSKARNLIGKPNPLGKLLIKRSVRQEQLLRF